MLFFEAWVYKITHKEGRFLFDLLRDILEKCCRNYPRIGSVLSIYAGNHSQMKGMLDTLFKNRGWFGHYRYIVIRLNPNLLRQIRFMSVSIHISMRKKRRCLCGSLKVSMMAAYSWLLSREAFFPGIEMKRR